jgi:LysM repeat protein
LAREVIEMKQFLIVTGLVIAALIPGARAVSARQERPTPVETVLVQPGDTLWRIAGANLPGDRREGVYRIMELNHLDSSVVVPGQRLKLPAA